ncbi:MAG: D-alanine--poly(phosphoribitol) ligase subunit DltA [Kurthia sp.]|nr:D-alanine--poly(phosphoribitol) ligase subunit DltA [Candidatus Kurthia equi]
MNLLQQMAEVVVASPNKVAYQVGAEVLTYGELWEQSNAVADRIVVKKLPKHCPIVVYGHMSPHQIIAFIGVVKAGHPYIPIDISIPSDRIIHIIKAANSPLVLTSEPFNLAIESEAVEIADLILTGEKTKDYKERWISEEEVFYIIYTSGSTGNPKGVQISHSNLMSFVHWLKVNCILSEGVYLNQAPYSFDLSVMDLYPSLTSGSKLHAITKSQIENASLLFKELEDSKIKIWTSTPSFVKICLMNPQWDAVQMPYLTTFLFCGEVLPHQVATALSERFPQAKIYNLYGPTETTVAVSAVEITKDILLRYKQLPIARVTSSVVKIADENSDRLSNGEKGEITVWGPTVSKKGYLFDAQQSMKVFKNVLGERMYKTGDLAYEKDGFIFYAGRSDFQIKLHGYRMEIEEIEKQIENLDEVMGCIVIPIKKGDEIISLTACVVLKESIVETSFLQTRKLKRLLESRMPSYMIPKKILYMEVFPLTMNGKVDRKRMAVEMNL